MILTRIELNNFGSYRNSNAFTINTGDSQKKIVIIGGKNGAGKTTLFTAIELALYGHYCFGYKNTGKLYTKKVMTYVNDIAKLDDEESAYVSLDFSDSSNGDLDHYSVTRRWTWRHGDLRESFSAIKNGKQMRNRDLVDFQNFLLHLIPPALLKLCFFDGERIAEYLLDDQKNNIRDALMVLSGNDTFDIMHTSVKKVFSASQSEEDLITREYLRCKSALKKLNRQRQELTSDIANLQAQQDDRKAEIDRLKKEYAEQGGISLDEWRDLTTALKAEEDHRERINWERKATAADILPFLVVGPMLDRVRPQILKEHEYKTWKAVSSSIQNDALRQIIINSVKSSDAENATSLGSKVYEDIVNFLVPTNGWTDFSPLFGLSDDDETRVQAVLNRVAQFDLKKIPNYKRRIDKSIERSKQIREKLQNSSVENYQAHTDAVAAINQEVFDLSLQLQIKNTELTSCDAQIIAAEKALEAAYKKLELDIKRRSVSAVSSSVLLLLEDLQESLFERLLSDVKRDTLSAFNRLIRKKRFIDDIEIDRDFRVHLLRKQIVEKHDIEKIFKRSGAAGVKRSLREYAFKHLCQVLSVIDEMEFAPALAAYDNNEFELLMEINKDTLSKGETQVFVMSLYWAMMQQCKCELPFIIDTPFARIDTDHRANIVEQFFKKLPGQLFVLSTNEEISSTHMASLAEQTSSVFLLEYGDDKCTRIIENRYFEV